ncbi:MAG TPA: hypothetical protein LFV92_06515 [Rickettsia endosymbiont of Ceroptres masudai]|nr:hypothetical protein [Rickettsia endosymbiont of Ceroptres masudai]
MHGLVFSSLRGDVVAWTDKTYCVTPWSSRACCMALMSFLAKSGNPEKKV